MALEEVSRLRSTMRKLLRDMYNLEMAVSRRQEQLELRVKLLEIERAGRAAEAQRASDFNRKYAATKPWNVDEDEIRAYDDGIAAEEKTWPRRKPN